MGSACAAAIGNELSIALHIETWQVDMAMESLELVHAKSFSEFTEVAFAPTSRSTP